jgi:hypothetical protein
VAAVNAIGTGPFTSYVTGIPAAIAIDPYYYDNTLLMHFDDNRTGTFDQYGDYVSLLMHMDGANNQTSFSNSDSSKYKREVTRYGDTKLSSDQAYFGTTSAYFDGSGDYLEIPNANDMSFGAGDFTVELWVNVSDLNRDNFIFGTNTPGNFMIQLSTGGQLYMGRHNVAWDANITHNIQANTWTHIAVARSQGTMRFFINGSIIGSSFTNNNSYSIDTLLIGSHGGGAFFNGYMDDLRVTNGIARYTSNFSIPTEAFPQILPLFVDSSAYNNSLIVSSTSITSDFSKFGGYAGYFNGSSLVRSPGSNIWQLGTEDFTVESWINPNNIAGTRSIVGNYDGSDGGWRLAVKSPSGGTPSYGPEVSFTKTDGGSEVDILIPGELVITRANNYSIYNSAKQSAWTAPIYQMGPQNPTDTEWALGWSDPCNLTAKTFVGFTNLWGGGGILYNIVNAELMMRHIPTGRIWLIKFSSWSQGGGGQGGFAYTRKELTCSTDSSIVEFRNGNSTVIEKTITPPIPTGVWSHVAAVRSSGVLRLFLDGTQVGSNENFTANITRNNSYGLSIGAYTLSNGSSSDYFNGYLDDLRITKGFARYSENFVSPISSFPNNGPAPAVPSEPLGLSVSEENHVVSLSWTKPLDPKASDTRSPISYYGVEYSKNGGSSWIEDNGPFIVESTLNFNSLSDFTNNFTSTEPNYNVYSIDNGSLRINCPTQDRISQFNFKQNRNLLNFEMRFSHTYDNYRIPSITFYGSLGSVVLYYNNNWPADQGWDSLGRNRDNIIVGVTPVGGSTTWYAHSSPRLSSYGQFDTINISINTTARTATLIINGISNIYNSPMFSGGFQNVYFDPMQMNFCSGHSVLIDYIKYTSDNTLTTNRTFIGLDGGTLYTFRVRAQNSLGFGPYSSTANISTMQVTPTPTPTSTPTPTPTVTTTAGGGVQGFVVSGAGSSAFNGTYCPDGILNGKTRYKLVGTNYTIEYTNNWVVNDEENYGPGWLIQAGNSDWTFTQYFNLSSSDTLPLSGWAAYSASSPAPTLSSTTC